MSTTKQPNGDGKPFQAIAFMHKLGEYVRANPDLASRAYALAAQRMRRESQLSPNTTSKLQFQLIASELDRLSAEETIPAVDPDYFEEVREYADHPMMMTEYDGIVFDIAASKVGENGEGVGDLASAVQFQQLQETRDRLVASPVQIIPASVKPGVTVLGQQALVQYGGNKGLQNSTTPNAVQEAPVIRWDGREQEAMPVTVHLNRSLGGQGATFPAASSGGTNYTYRPFAHVLWGSGNLGEPNEAYVDVGRGCQFTVHASFVYVNVGMDAPGSGLLNGSMMLGASLGFFAGSGRTPAQRTVYIDSLAASGTSTIVIPSYATGLLPIQTSQNQLSIDVRDVAGTIIYSIPTFAAGSQITPLPLSSDAYDIVVTNQAASAANIRAIFDLAL